MGGTVALSYEQLFTIHRTTQEMSFSHRILLTPAKNKAVHVTINPGTSRPVRFGVLADGKRVPVDAL